MDERFQTFTVLVTRIARAIRKIKTEEMAEFDLKSPHVSCLYYLFKEKSLTAKELCDICSEDKAAISRSIDHLETSGYLSCEVKSGKRYKAQLFLTEKGALVGGRIAEKIDCILEKSSEGVSEADRLVMYKSLEVICRNLERLCEKYDE